MGRALQGFGQEQGKGGVSCRPGESRPPGRCVARWPLGLPPPPGHRWAAAGWSLPWRLHLASGSGSWRVSCMYPSGTAQMLPSGSYALPGHAWASSCLDTLLQGPLSSWSRPAGCLQPSGGRGAPTLAPSLPHLCHSPCRCSPLYRCSCGTRCWPGSSRGLHRGLRSRGHSLWGEAAVSGRLARHFPLGP